MPVGLDTKTTLLLALTRRAYLARDPGTQKGFAIQRGSARHVARQNGGHRCQTLTGHVATEYGAAAQPGFKEHAALLLRRAEVL